MAGPKGKVLVFTSGGDAPGMNAAVRAAVRMGVHLGLEMWGAHGGYDGVIDAELQPMTNRSVSNIIQRGGTVLHTARSARLLTPEGRDQAAHVLRENGFIGLIAVGGDGTFAGLLALQKHWDGLVVGVPGTVDNDLSGTDFTIGFDTAVNTALDAIDRIRDTAASHDRIFLVEVMGRHSGFIALAAGIAGGAEHILIPETRTDIEGIGNHVTEGRKHGKTSQIIIVAEGDEAGGAIDVGKKLQGLIGSDYRVCVLGHIQRGGTPTAADRILATALGAFAAETVGDGVNGMMVGVVSGDRRRTPLHQAIGNRKNVDPYLIRLIDILSH